MNKTGPKRHFHDEQFKRDAVALVTGGRKLTELARELGISHWTLRDWKDRYGSGAAAASLPARSAGPASAGGPSAVAAAVELAALRREVEHTRRQNDILKKALAIVAQQEPNDTTSSKPSTASSRS